MVSAFGRSWQLVRRRFWLTLGLVTLPVQFEQWALHAIHYAEIFDHPVVPAFLLNGLLGAVIGSIVGLVEVVLTYELIEEDAVEARARSRAIPLRPSRCRSRRGLGRTRRWRPARCRRDPA